MLVPRRRLRRGVRRRGKNGKDRRSFGFAQAFGRGRGFAQPWCLSELTRTDPNACTISTSWGSLVRAQYRPLKSPARAFLLLLLGPESDKSVEQYESIARRVEVPGFDGVSVFHDLFHQPAIFPLLAMAHVTERVRLCPAAPKPDDAPSGRDRPRRPADRRRRGHRCRRGWRRGALALRRRCACISRSLAGSTRPLSSRRARACLRRSSYSLALPRMWRSRRWHS
jgi:hypothetical protein